MEFARGGSLVRFATSGRRLSVKSPEMGWSPMHLTCEKMQEVGMLAIEMNPDDLVAAAGIVEYYMPSTKCSGNSASGAFHVADYPEPVITVKRTQNAVVTGHCYIMQISTSISLLLLLLLAC